MIEDYKSIVKELKECLQAFPEADRLKYDDYYRGLHDAYHHLAYSLPKNKKWWQIWK